MRLASIAVGLWISQIAAAATLFAQDGAQDPRMIQSSGPEIQFDTQGIEFGPWITRFVSQVRHHWLIPCAAINESGHTVLTFYVHADGTITDVDLRTPARIAIFNENAQVAILASSPTLPLPSGYPAPQAFFTATFYYSELPPGSSRPAGATTNRLREDSACFLLGLNASDVERRLGKPAHVDGLRWTYITSAGVFAVYFDDGRMVIDVQPSGFDLTIFKT